MSTQETTSKEYIQAVFEVAGRLMRQKKSREQIVQALANHGVDRTVAQGVIDKLEASSAQGRASVGRRNMLFGALWFIGGTVVTLATYEHASDGGSYIIAYGAIIGGLVQFFMGCIQASR